MNNRFAPDIQDRLLVTTRSMISPRLAEPALAGVDQPVRRHILCCWRAVGLRPRQARMRAMRRRWQAFPSARAPGPSIFRTIRFRSPPSWRPPSGLLKAFRRWVPGTGGAQGRVVNGCAGGDQLFRPTTTSKKSEAIRAWFCPGRQRQGICGSSRSPRSNRSGFPVTRMRSAAGSTTR